LEKIATSLPDVWEFRPTILRDSRGFFLETYQEVRFRELGVSESFVQDNHSCSVKGTLRGLHYQLRHPQAKLCRVVEGTALDVAVDIRVGSPTFGEWASVTLSFEHLNEIYIPAGFAHGFLALSDRVQFLYKCSNFYDAADEHGVLWNDPDIGIEWRTLNPLVSEKDSQNLKLSDIPSSFLPRYIPK
jgi:dTDP-4-dehydrorhamnose 3,5-epimerase